MRIEIEWLPMEVEIVEANLSDPHHAQSVLAMLDSYARDAMGIGRPLNAEPRERLLAGLNDHPTSLVFLAFDGERPVGIAVCFVGFSTFNAKPLINVHDLAVQQETRGQGIGRRLLEVVQSKAEQLGCCKVTLEVREDNHPALGLYRSQGFGAWEGQATTLFLEKPLGEARKV